MLRINDEANNYYYFAIKNLAELNSLRLLRGKKEEIINNNINNNNNNNNNNNSNNKNNSINNNNFQNTLYQ